MVHCRGRSILLAAVVVVGMSTVGVRAASAQGVGVQGGFSIDPEQVYVGSHFETPELVDRLHFRPGIEGGFGEDLALASINLEFIYKIPLQGDRWTLYQGSGPAINIYRFDDQTDTRAGFNFSLGLAHASGFFTEFRVGTGNSPNLKLGVGYTVR